MESPKFRGYPGLPSDIFLFKEFILIRVILRSNQLKICYQFLILKFQIFTKKESIVSL